MLGKEEKNEPIGKVYEVVTMNETCPDCCANVAMKKYYKGKISIMIGFCKCHNIFIGFFPRWDNWDIKELNKDMLDLILM